MHIARLFPILAVLAMLFASVAMLGGGAAMAGHIPESAMTMDHCDGMAGQDEKQQSAPSPDCAIACAAIAPTHGPIAAMRTGGAALYHLATFTAFRGLDPETEIPPPRFS